MVFVILASCPIKSGIRSLAGVPVNTEQGTAKNNHSFLGGQYEDCVNDETADTKVTRAFSSDVNDLLPAVLLTAAFLFLAGYVFRTGTLHPRYRSLKIPGTLPIFLQYRKLII